MMHYCLALLVATLLSSFVPTRAQGATVSSREAAGASVEYLRRVMDQYHAQFIVYEDVSAPGNHFHAWAKIPNELAPVECSGSDTTNPRSGATAIRCAFHNTSGPNFGGFYFLNLQPPGCTSFACIVFWQGGLAFTTTPQPILRNWTIGPFNGPIFSYTFGGTEPTGTYVWLGAFVVPGTGTLIGGIAQALFIFNP